MDYSRADQKSNKKLYAVVGILGIVGVLAIIGVAHTNDVHETNNLLQVKNGNVDYEPMFRSWMKHYKTNYSNFKEYLARFSIFVDNVRMMERYNNNGNSYTVGVNQFADLTRDEFRKQYTGLHIDSDRVRNEVYLSTVDLPDTVDWSKKGAVTPIKNQGQCGSCWAFSTTGSVEGLHFLKTGTLASYSEQQLVDCSGSYGNQGCNGGLMDDAFKYIEDHGIEKESDYPYEARDDSCRATSSKTAYKITGFHDVPAKNNLQLKAAVNQQPVSVAIEADQFAFQFYSGGVLTGDCGTNLDHGVLAVGYGTDNGTPYWKVKNSWGASWGMSGYVLLERTDSTSAGKCGIALQASYPTA